jgi:methionyl-tRNA formyltransferase
MIAFFGTPEFAAVHLAGLLDAGLPVGLVVTRPDTPRGRGRVAEPSAVRAFAAARGIETLAPARARDAAFVETLGRRAPDLFLVVAYGGILPREALAIPRLGAVNLHASLLPRWRGAAPIAWAILAGDATTGVTSFFLEEEVDAGEVILARETPIGPAETAGGLTGRLALLGRDVLVETARLVLEGRAPRRAQDARGVTLAPRLSKEDGWIPWDRTAEEIARFVRAMTPWPGARSLFREEAATIVAAEAVAGRAEPGRVVVTGKETPAIGTGSGLLRIAQIKMPGRRAVSGEEFVRGARPRADEAFRSPHPTKVFAP